VSVLLKHEIPLPQALRLASAGVSNANVGQLSTELAERASEGQSVSQAISAEPQFPRSLVPLLRWGEQAGMLAEAFAAGHDMFVERARNRALLLQTVLPPVLFIAIACIVLFVVGALFSPIGSLIHSLSG
jgi:type II secretory pathway component PulF